MYSKEYDQGYNSGLKDRCEHGNTKHSEDPKSDLVKGYNHAKQYIKRSKELSALANDDHYQNFLHAIASTLGNDSILRYETIDADWVTGGQTGASCYGSDDIYALDGETPRELDEFDKIIEIVAPEIPFIKYKNLCHEVLHTHTYCDSSDYYGNYYNHATKYVTMPELYQALKDRNLL